MLPVRQLSLPIFAAGLLLCALLPLSAQEENPMLPEERAALFDYDAKIDLQVEVIGTEERHGALIQDVTFVPIPDEAPVKAYIIAPLTPPEHNAGILWGHWLGEHKSNREQFVDEAVALASEGVVSVLPDTMWAKPGWYSARSAHLDEDYENGIRQVIRFRRAMDLLVAQPSVDADRMAFVGHDYSGMYGMLASAVDGRAKAYVFIAVAPSFYDWAFYSAQPKNKDAYTAQNDVLEPMEYLPFIHGDILFQFAEQDFYVSEARRQLNIDTAPDASEVKIYEKAEHSMTDPEIAEDRDAWLRDKLGLNA